MLGLGFSGQKQGFGEDARQSGEATAESGSNASLSAGSGDLATATTSEPTTARTSNTGFGARAKSSAQADIDGHLTAASDVGMAPDAAADGEMQVIVFTSQKGGSGKTTMCGQLAVAAEMAGAGPIALIDCDPQGSLSDWWNSRSQPTPMFVQTSVDRLGEDLAQLRQQGINLVFVDTPPSVTDTIRDIVSHADMVVIPTRPSPHDLRAVGATLDIVDSNGKPLVFAVNGATKRAKITSDTAVALSQHGTVAPVTVHHRNDFATSMIKGGAVMETNPTSKSSQEIIELWQYLSSRIRKVERRKSQHPSGAAPAPQQAAPAKKFGATGSRAAGGFGRRPGD